MNGLIPWAIFGFIIIMIFAIVSNSGQTGTANIQSLMDRLNCPMPSGTGLWNNTNVLTLDGGTYNYPNVSNQTLTLTCTDVHTADNVDYFYGQPAVAIGVFYYANDYLSELFFNKVSAIFTMIGYILAPINFDVWGYTIGDLSGVALMVVIALYVFAYIPIGIIIYKTISPFTGL
jgi:hypothetical protein